MDALPSDGALPGDGDEIMGTVKKSIEVVSNPAGNRNTGMWVVCGMGMVEGVIMPPSLSTALSPTPHTYSWALTKSAMDDITTVLSLITNAMETPLRDWKGTMVFLVLVDDVVLLLQEPCRRRPVRIVGALGDGDEEP